MHPVAAEGAAVGALALGDLVLVVGEDQVLTAGVQVDGLAQVLAGHGAALNVPAGAAVAPGALPVGLAGLGRLPDCEIGGVLLQVVVHTAAQLTVAALEVVEVQMAQLAVAGVGLDAEVDIPVAGHIGVAGVHEVLDDVDDLADMLGSAGAHGGGLDVQTVGIPDVLGLKLAGDLLHRGAFLLALFDELVINIGDVGDIVDLVAAVFQIAAQRIKDDHRARVADVDIVVNRRAADIDAVLALLLGDKFLFLAGHGVEDLHSLHVPSSI